MRRRTTAAALAAAVTAGLLTAAPAGAVPTPSPNAAWPSPGQDVKDRSAPKPRPITGSPITLQPDAGRSPLVVVENDQEKGGNSFTIPSDVLFDKDSAELSGNASANLDNVVKRLQDAGVSGAVKIVGHTDDTGTKRHNLTLSKQRAKAVNDALTDKLRNSGIRLKWSGVGEAGPLAKNDSEANRKRNRRVAIIYKASSGGSTSDQYDFSVPLTQSVTKPPASEPGAIASAVRTVKLNQDTTYTVRLDVMGLHRQDKLLRLDLRTVLVGQNGTTSFDDIGRVFSGTEDATHEDDQRSLLFDPDKKQQLAPLITGKGDVVANLGDGDELGAGGIRQGYIYFPAPTTGAAKLSYYVPMFGTFDGLPIT
ncbi:MAG TPA: OmpA family protein [Streptosporangiaceae bacterium]